MAQRRREYNKPRAMMIGTERNMGDVLHLGLYDIGCSRVHEL